MPVNPDVVRWARERAGYSQEEARKMFRDIAEWEAARAKPTYPQLERMADQFKCPVAVFFFPAPPDVPPINQTFRTLPDSELQDIPRNMKLLLRKAKAMQLSLAELTDGTNPAPRMITRDMHLQSGIDASAIAASIRRYLGVTIEEQFGWKSTEEALEYWRTAVTDAGIFVFKDAFKQHEYFGFCLYDAEFPIIYINNSAAKTRQIFTILHELVHLLFHTSGIDVLDDHYIENLAQWAQDIEAACNRIAALVLVPPDDFEAASRGLPPTRETASQLAERFSTSREVIYRRFLDLRRITGQEYREAVSAWADDVRRSGSGGDYYNNQMAYLGRRYVGLALERYHQNKIDLVQLADYLNVKAQNIAGLEDRYLRAASR